MTFKKFTNFFTKISFVLISCILINHCGIWDPADARKVPVNAKDRVKKNIEEGKSVKFKNLNKGGSGNVSFATSNEMWRASLDKLSFVPLNVVDYGGGVIITDWFGDNTNDEIKITVRFLSNEIRSDALKIIIHQKKCESFANCTTTEINNSTNNEVRLAILKKAAEIEKNDTALQKEEKGEYRTSKN